MACQAESPWAHGLFGKPQYLSVMTNIAMENGPFVGDLPIQMVIFGSYVKFPEGKKGPGM